MTEFVHLHTHTSYSLLDGLSDIKAYVERAKKIGQSALAITDHGLISGAPEFYQECRKNEIEPIIGEEFYFQPEISKEEKKEDKDKERFHVVILARGEPGYKVLCQLSTESHKRFYYKPLIDRELLESLGEDAQHLTVLSGCAASMISKLAIAGDLDQAGEEIVWWREIFDNFYIELQHHNTDFDMTLNKRLLKLAKRYSVPWVITNDPHYASPKESHYHDALLAIQTASNIDDPERFKFDGTGYHLRSKKQMKDIFAQYPETVWKKGLKNTNRIAKDCFVRIPDWETRSWHIPSYPDTDDAFKELVRLAKRGLRKKGLDDKDEYYDRMMSELKVIKKAKIGDFLLITRDIIRFAQDQGIPVGPGRGSVAGSLVGYLIGLHKIDPIRYDLIFERFLNPARPRVPDIDTDFSPTRRDEVFEYVTNKYGKENVLHICTFQKMKLKSAFQQLAKAHGMSWGDSVRISKTLSEDDEDLESLPDEVRTNYPELADLLKNVVGVKRAISTHPAGIIISDPSAKIRELVPEMYIPRTKKFVAQYDLEAVEGMGLMKEDILGLRTLDTIAECVKLVEESTGEVLDPDSWIPDEEEDDEGVYQMLAEGRTAGVFQMEGPTNTRGIQDIRPTRFEDIVSCTSLYRTGAISAGFPKIFLENRRGGTPSYVHPSLQPILGRTEGVVLYQEQVMEIGRHCAGFSMAQEDDIKEAIKHKKSDLMQSMKQTFIDGCQLNQGMNSTAAKEIWRMIEGYAGYGYNRAHAVSYTFITYQTARLKYLYPAEFLTALLRTVDKKEKRIAYLQEAVDMGLKIVLPCINRSDLRCRPALKGRGIRFGFEDIKGIGAAQAKKLLDYRKKNGMFEDLEEVEEAAKNVGVIKSLKESGALSDLGVAYDKNKLEEMLGWQFKDPMRKIREKYAKEVRLPGNGSGRVKVIGEIYEVTKGTTKHGQPFMTWKLRYSPTEAFDVRLWSDSEDVWDMAPKGSIVMVSGPWQAEWMNITVTESTQVKILRSPNETEPQTRKSKRVVEID